MANCSDAFGTIKVSKVGQEFLEFLEKAQVDQDAYYKLAEEDDFKDVKPDENGDLEFSFSTMGRWSYSSNLEGYLKGEWLSDCKEHYDEFTKALKEKNGSVVVEYTDSDVSTDWMGTGVAQLRVVDGEVDFVEMFDSQSISIKGYAELTGMSERDAFEAMHGDEYLAAYDKYVDECEKKGETAESMEDWYEDHMGEI